VTQVGAPVASRTATAGPSTAGDLSYVEWSAVLAGAVLAAALSFVLLTFGAAIGLSATSPWPNSGLPTRLVASLAVFWTMAQQIGAIMVGGYVAGRMRTRWHESGHEAEFRDGLHGALVWAIGVLISALLVFTTVGAAARTGADVAGRAAGSAVGSANPLDTALDAILRPTSTTQAAAPTASPQRANTANTDETRAEMARILAGSITSGTIAPEKRTQLAQLLTQRTGISQQEAERRVDEAVNAARAAADKARHAAILTGFVTAASLLVSLAAGWWAAMRGGHHRDTSLPARFTFGITNGRPVSNRPESQAIRLVAMKPKQCMSGAGRASSGQN
jgi:hypothetical protein